MAPTASDVPDRPALALGVELAGEMKESGFTEQQWLVQRDGQFVQLTELLYRVCEQADGERTVDEIADAVSGTSAWTITGDQVRYLIANKLAPLGLVQMSAGAEPVAAPAVDPIARPLGLNMRATMIGPRVIDPITRVLQVLYAPVVLVPMLAAITVAHVWLYAERGSAMLRGLRDMLYSPLLMLVVLLVMLLAGVVHEFGHAAALRYGGGRSRGMGVGLYMIYPAIYTDTSDSYRLGRWARVRTDLGGFYFYLIFALGLMALHHFTGHDVLLLVVVLINLDILYQCLPFVRFDGYWAMADLTGIPDPFTAMKPFLRSLRPGAASGGDRLPPLKPWVRRVFLAYILLALPALAVMLFLFVTRAPSMLMMAWDSYVQQAAGVAAGVAAGDWVRVALGVIQALLLVLVMAAIAYTFYNLGRMVLSVVLGLRKRRPQTA